jgi:hypothetical protein
MPKIWSRTASAFAGTKDCKVEESVLEYGFACFLKGQIDEV